MKNERITIFLYILNMGPLYSFSTVSKGIEGNLDKITFE